MLDELKNKKRKKTGRDPSYSEILDDVFKETEFGKKKEKEKRKKERDFLELF